MGQRSQIYIRYNNGENLVAYHLQWNWGRYMINRTFQLLDFINKNIEDDYSIFKSKNFDFVNREYKDREDLKALKSLIEMNLDVGSVVSGHDLIKEELWYSDELKEEFVFNPERQDNNNGILVIDVVEDGDNTVLKYGLTRGYEGLSENESEDTVYKIVSATEYFKVYENEFDYYMSNAKTNKERLEIIAEREKIKVQAELIDESYTLMTQKEYEKIFEKAYSYEKCLSKDDFEECKKKLITNYIQHSDKSDIHKIISKQVLDTICENDSYNLSKDMVEEITDGYMKLLRDVNLTIADYLKTSNIEKVSEATVDEIEEEDDEENMEV